ncbi:carbon starvation CstA family protein [Gemmiger formicilis]|uniref:carbon starvation CstA family protein n=1 Tax=Gemmiger formicilis TaxID=745368 RepID=UPI003521F9D0
MNTLVIVLIAAVVLVCAYAGYGRWLAKTWGVDPNAKTPAVRLEDGKDYVPTNGWTVFAHQFSSIAGAGPVTGAIQAAAFGWLPVLLWVLIGGIFFGAVTDFGALYASVKNDGKSMGLLIEKYIGKTGRKLFLLFCWLFCGIVIAAFADMVAGTFNAFDADGAQVEAANDQRRCRHGLHHVHGVRRYLRPAPEKVQLLRLERKRTRHCLHRAVLCASA